MFLFRPRRPPSPTLFPYTTLFRSPCTESRALASTSRAGTSAVHQQAARPSPDRKSTRLNSSHVEISYAVFCLKKKNVPGAGDVAVLEHRHERPQTGRSEEHTSAPL